jgi:hypothetical protein
LQAPRPVHHQNTWALLPANSLSVLRLQAGGINSITNLLLQIPSPIVAGQIVASTALGQKVFSLSRITDAHSFGLRSTCTSVL